MPSKLSLKFIFILITVVGLVSTVAVIFFAQYVPAKQEIQTQQNTEFTTLPKTTPIVPQQIATIEPSIGLPVHMWVPRLHIDAPLERVGLTKEGAVDIPKGPTSPAWYEYGPRPGEIGSAIIVGHFGWKNGIPAVFDHLNQIAIGDQVVITSEVQGTQVFVVRKIRTYHKDDVAKEIFISTDGKAHLNLITCMGDWDKAEESYADRLVIFTDKIE